MMRYKQRYVLGEGFPWAIGVDAPYYSVRLNQEVIGMKCIPLDWPEELWDPNLPRYRLVLERISKSR